MPDSTAQIITLLSSIDTTLKRMASAAKTQTAETAVADARDLDSQHGDPTVRFLPRDWSGDLSFKGQPFSQCPPELLDLVASSLDWLAQKAQDNDEVTSAGKPVAPYKRRDAARARGWARRKRDGWQPPTSSLDPLLDSDDPEIDPFSGSDDDISF